MTDTVSQIVIKFLVLQLTFLSSYPVKWEQNSPQLEFIVTNSSSLVLTRFISIEYSQWSGLQSSSLGDITQSYLFKQSKSSVQPQTWKFSTQHLLITLKQICLQSSVQIERRFLWIIPCSIWTAILLCTNWRYQLLHVMKIWRLMRYVYKRYDKYLFSTTAASQSICPRGMEYCKQRGYTCNSG